MGHHVGYMVVAQAAHGQLVTSTATLLEAWNACRFIFTAGNHPWLSLPPQGHVLAWWWPRLHKGPDGRGRTDRMDGRGRMDVVVTWARPSVLSVRPRPSVRVRPSVRPRPAQYRVLAWAAQPWVVTSENYRVFRCAKSLFCRSLS